MLQLRVVDDPPLGHIDEEHAARLQPPLEEHVLRFDRQNADLGRHDHVVVLGDVVAGRAQAVAVEHGADLAAVGEGDRGGAVPGLHQARVVTVEVLLLLAHRLVAVPGLRDHHHDRVFDRAARHRQQFKRVVEAGGVAAGLVDHGDDALDVGDQVGLKERLAGAHPVDVAAQRVDFAVVGDHAVRVRELPAGERVCAEARVEHAERALHAPVGQVWEVIADLGRDQHALVDQCLRREAGHVERLCLRDVAPVERVAEELADHEQASLERLDVRDLFAAADEHVEHVRLSGQRGRAKHRIVRRHSSHAQEVLAVLLYDVLEEPQSFLLRGLVLRREEEAHAVVVGLGKADTLVRAGVGEEVVRNLDQDAGAVARVHLAAAGAAVLKVLQGRDAVFDHLVRSPPLEVHQKADAAAVVLVSWVVEPGRLRPGGAGGCDRYTGGAAM